MEHRFQWTAPVMLSPHDPNTLYHAGERLFKTTDGGVHWQAISPDSRATTRASSNLPAATSPSTTPAPSSTTPSLQ